VNTRIIYVVIAMVSGAALALEILLMRLFSIVQWHHFAYMMISIALLGFAASGTFVALRFAHSRSQSIEALPFHAACFASSALLCFHLAQALPFNPLEIIWNHRQWAYLSLIYCLLLLPFFFASNCICLALLCRRWPTGYIYGADLAGAALGVMSLLLALWFVHPAHALLGVGAVAGMAAVLAYLHFGTATRATRGALIASVLAIGIAGVFAPHRSLHPSEYKSLPEILRIPGTAVIDERFSPAGLISIVRSTEVPLRHVPGLSLGNQVEPPEQLGAFIDADSLTPITRYRVGATDLGYLENVTDAVPYSLLQQPRVLILGSGGGASILQALHFGAGKIDAVELNLRLVELLIGPYANYSGNLSKDPRVRLHVAEARSYVSRSSDDYDLIQIPVLESFGSAGAGLRAIREDYIYTVEAVSEYLDRLAPGGMLALSHWVRLPPRDGIKLFATAVTALEQRGHTDPGSSLAWIRGWQTQLILIKNGALTEAERNTIRSFSESRWLDVAHLPGLGRSSVNRYNVLAEPYFHEAAQAILGNRRESFYDAYKFDVIPVHDGRPFFHHFFKWSLLRELAAMPARQGWAFLDLAYPILLATLAQAVIAGFVFVLLPLIVFRNRFRRVGTASRPSIARTGSYFLAIGFGFMFIEIAAIQKFTLYIGQPIYAAALVIGGFLIFAGIGSALIGRWESMVTRKQTLLILGSIPILAVCEWMLLPDLFGATLAMPAPVRWGFAMAAIAPLALLMGVPLPAALSRIPLEDGALAAWAWGVNGFASVLGAVLATLFAIHLGIFAVVVAASFFYLIAAGLFASRGAFATGPG